MTLKPKRTEPALASLVRGALLAGLLGLAPGASTRAAEAPPAATAGRPNLTLEAATPIGPPGVARPDSTPPDLPWKLAGTDLEGRPLDLAELLGHGPVLVDFWALWCKPCLKELPELDRIQARWAERGLAVVAVNTDAPVELARVRPFVRSARYRFRVMTDAAGELKRRFEVNTLPTALLLAPDGRVLWTNQGYRPGDEKALERALARYFAAPTAGGQ